MYNVLSTKKLDPSLINKAKENNITITEKELISIQPGLNKETNDKITALAPNKSLNAVFTSANAVSALNNYMAEDGIFHDIGWNVFCLSGKTKQAVLSSNFLSKGIKGEAQNAKKLSSIIIDQNPEMVVFFCGNKRRNELPIALQKAGIVVNEVVLYETTETPLIIHEDYDAILFFSPSAVQSFFSVNEINKSTVCFAIGSTTASCISSFTTNEIKTSSAPSDIELVKEMIGYFNQKSTVY